MHKIGIDLGGTKIEGVILDQNNAQIFRERIDTEQNHGYQHILQRIRSLYNRMMTEIREQPHTLGIGTPGSISPATRLMRNSNTQCLNKQPLKDDLEQLLGRQLTIANDANCFALAEALRGAASGFDLVFGVIMGTGCGGGIVAGGKAINGRQANAGEWGHVSIDPKGPPCWCGQPGCIETMISGGGLEKLYKQKFGQELAFTNIVQKYRQKQDRETAFIKTFFENFGRGMATVVNILDPDVIVLGGGLSNFEELYTDGVEEVKKRVFSDYFDTPIVKNQLGDSAGVIGAALIGI